MRLAFALFTFFPHGGLTRDLVAIARACRRRGHEVRVYAGENAAGACVGAADDDVDLRLVPVAALTNHGKGRRFAAQLKNATADFAPDLLVGFNKMPALDVYYAADGCFADKARRRGWWYRATPRCRRFLAMEKSVFGADARTKILTISDPQARAYREFYDTPPARMHRLPPGIARDRAAGDDAPARRKSFRAQWQLGDDDKLLLALGSGFRTKGLDRTLRALASLPAPLCDRTQLVVVGDDKTARFKKIARRLGVAPKVRFAGGRDDVPEFLFGADLLVHPARRENTGTALLEAMVAGLPVVATDVCGYAHHISDARMGEVLPSPFEQSALNESLPRLLEAAPNQWRKRGREFANTADIYDMPDRACRLLEEIFAKKQS